MFFILVRSIHFISNIANFRGRRKKEIRENGEDGRRERERERRSGFYYKFSKGSVIIEEKER
jgi:hypothetical protein